MAEMSKYARAVRSYEISIWTLQDRFLSVLKWATQDHKGQIQEPEMTIRDDGTQELSFIIPKFYWVGANKIQNPMWLHLEDQPLEANMHKLKVIFNKNSSDEEVFEFLVTEVTHDHSDDRVELTVKAEGLAYHELGKIGYKISLSQETFTTAFDEWVDGGMAGDQPQENLQFWNDLIFKNSKGQWKGNWKYEIQMDWSSYSYQKERETDKVYEDEYVSSWQVENGKLSPRAVEISKEKWRPVEVKESNLYNITQTIAEEFGIFCRYEYEHDENYQLLPESRDENGNPIPTRKVIYYNNFYYDTDGHIDLTYPYSSNAITRTVDNSNIVTKMYVPQVEYEDETITIMDVEANKSKEDYLLDFEYLHNIQAITDEQYAEIDDYEAAMHTYNSTLFRIQERIRVLENQLIDTSARVTTLTNALKLDEEQESEAARLLRGIRGGSEDIPISTILTVMTGEGTNSDWYQYVTVTRWQGLNPESIHLYENSDTKMGYTDSIGFIVRRDENGEISHLTNLVRTADDSQVYIQATYNPYDYYKRMIERWKTREVLDEQDLAAAKLEEAKINWYLHGNRVGYGIVGGIIMGDATYPVGVTMYDEPWPEDDLSRSDRTGEMRIVGTNEEAAEWQAAEPPKPDPFADIDLTDTTPDLYYNLAYYLEEKAAYFNAFEKMMGPAMREGYWQPDNYHDYGDQYHDNITISKVAGDKPSPTTPYVQWKWDYEKYYTNETPVLYRVGIDAKPNAHLIIDISKCLDVIREHLDDLSFIYVDPATIYAVDALEDEITSLKEGIENETCNLSITDSDSDPLRKNTHLCWLHYDEAKNTHTTYFNSIPDKSNENFEPLYTSVLPEDLSTDSSEATEITVDEVTQATEEWRIGLKELYENLNNSITEFAANYDYNNPVYTFKGEELDLDVINARLEELTDLQDQYQNVILNENNDNKPKIEKYSARITWCQNQIKLIQQVYDSISEYIFAPLSRAEAWIPRSIETLKDNIYNIYQIGADCELGWVRISRPEQDESGKIINSEESRPVLFVTGASGLSDDELNYIMTGYYAKEKLDVTDDRYEDSYEYIGNEYAPFLGLYNVEINDILNEEGSVQTKAQISVEKLYKIPWAGDIGYINALLEVLNNDESIFVDGLRRNNLPDKNGLRAVMQDYDGTGAKRWIKDEEYGIRRIFPRIYFSTLKLKNNSSDLKILLNKVLLENNTHYYTVQDDRSTGLKVQGIGYYTTLKPEVIYRMAGDIGDIQLVYTVSNVDTAIYLDALKVMHENATPKISYDVELSILNPNFIHTAYKRLNQIVYINDNDLNLDEVSGYISAVTMKLDKPWEDQVEVKNYETKFEDLFSTIVAQTEAMKKSQGGITAALQAFSTNGLINSDILQDSLINTDLNLSFDSGDGELSISKQGIIGESSSGIVAYRGGGIFTATTKDSNGNWIWNTGIVPSGINANLITAGQLNTNLIKIYAGDEIRFQFNGDGLFAYKPFVIADKDMAAAIQGKENYTPPTNGIDSAQYVVYNSDGLALVAKEGTWYKVPNSNHDEKGQITNTWEYDQTTAAEIKRVEISWNGLILRNWKNEEVFYADPDTGNLTLKGQIEATSGKIAGWTIEKDRLRSNHITIISNDQSAGIYLTRDRGAGDTRSIEYVEEFEGNASSFKHLDTPITFYGYTCTIENEKTGNEEIIRCYYPLGADESTPPPSFKYSANSETDSAKIFYQIESTIIQIRPKYIKIKDNKEWVADEEDEILKYGTGEIEYDGYGMSGPIIYDKEKDPKYYNWYDKLRQSGQDSYINYFYNEVARPISNIKNETVITLVDFAPTFQVRASDGEAIINKGTFGTLIADDSGMSGALTQVELSLDNYMMARTSESTYERVELGRCFYDSVYNKSTGKLTLKRLDGTTVTYKIGTGSGTSGGGSSSTTTCNDCTTNCNQNCATGCAFECGKQCASSCAGTCSGTCKGTCTNKVSGR